MNNLSSYCGLTDSRMSASDTDLPVPVQLEWNSINETDYTNEKKDDKGNTN